MLNSISWEQFIVTLSSVVAAYYLVATIIFYRREIADIIKEGIPFLRGVYNKESSSANALHEEPSTISTMGRAANEMAMTHLHVAQESSEEMVYAETDDLPDTINEAGYPEGESDEALVVTISDLLDKIKAVCGTIQDSVATNEEATSLFGALLSNYQSLAGTPYQTSITDHIYSITREPFVVNFSREEIEAFWSDHQ